MKTKITRKKSKKKELIYVDDRKVKWLTLDRLPTNVYQVRYQLLENGNGEVKTEYYTTAFGRKTPKGMKEIVELVQKVEQPTADWIWKRQQARGVIV